MEPDIATPEQEDADFTAAFAEFSPEEGAAAPVVKTPEEIRPVSLKVKASCFNIIKNIVEEMETK